MEYTSAHLCIVAQLKDPYLMIASNEEGCKELIVHEDTVGLYVSVHVLRAFVFRIDQYTFYSDLNRWSRNEEHVRYGHAALRELRSLVFVATF